ncbi:hypothetical protein BASA81_003071 [Batrachochytrium salamandrivorans]|nr:hypothetical protein BASA81_003071 [Batrachochytrium salamandrivorans]
MERRKRLGVVGLGRLGLSIALSFENKGFLVWGYDNSPERRSAVQSRELQSREPGVSQLLSKSKNLVATENLKDLFAEAEDKHLALCATVPPRYIIEVGTHLLRDSPGTTLSYLPDAALPLSYGDLLHHITRPEIVLIGEHNKEAGDYLEWMHREMIDTPDQTSICRMSPTSAEIAKLASSSYSAVRVSFGNFVTQIGEKTKGACAEDVLRVLQCDARFGSKCFRPGLGFGGPCIPRDNLALVRFANEVKVNADLLVSAQTMNTAHAEFMADMLAANNKGAQERIAIERVAFKEGCASDLIDESPKLEVARILAKRGHAVLIRDREGIVDLVRRQFGSLFDYEVIPN